MVRRVNGRLLWLAGAAALALAIAVPAAAQSTGMIKGVVKDASGQPVEVLTGFVKENGDAMGRPVGVAIDSKGALLVADDVGNVVWRVVSEGEGRSTPSE